MKNSGTQSSLVEIPCSLTAGQLQGIFEPDKFKLIFRDGTVRIENRYANDSEPGALELARTNLYDVRS